MSNSAPLDPQTPGTTTPTETPAAAPDFELTLRKFWEKNAKIITLTCATVVAIILAQGGLRYFRIQKEKGIAEAYAGATTSERLKSFASQHPEHVLGAAALLRLADEAYTAGQYADAATNYQKSAAIFKTGPFAGRARLGEAFAKIMSGQAADGETKLKQIADDTTLPKVIRAEAAYHLGALALDADRKDEALKQLDLVSTLDPTSSWAERALMIRATLPAPAAAAGTPPAITVKP